MDSQSKRVEPYFTFIEEESHFKVICSTVDGQSKPMRADKLIIEKKGCVIYTKQREQGDDEGGRKWSTYGVIGIMNIAGHLFIIIVSERQLVARMPSGDFIYLIKSVEMIPFDKNINDLNKMPADIQKYIFGVKQILEQQGFYYSYHADITSNLQRQDKVKFQFDTGQNHSYKFREQYLDKRYVWNHKIMQDFRFQNVDPFWTVPIIQGYIEQKELEFEGKQFEIMLISRRRQLRAGARLITRGIDDNSNVANFVESELIIAYDDKLFSMIQIRGSIPLFWEQKQKGLINHISVKRSLELSQNVFKGHLNDITHDYNRVLMVNLIRKKNPEAKLTAELQKQLLASGISSVKHVWYDFHGETHGDRFYKINELMTELEDVLTEFGFFVRERFGQEKIVQKQIGVFRTNCIDCLDRTNLMQAKLAIGCIERILQYISQENKKKGHKAFSEEIDGGKKFPENSFFAGSPYGPVYVALQDIFARNANELSRQYTNTDSNITRVTTKGDQGFMGKIEQWTIGVTRYYQCIMNDDLKNQCLQFITGTHPRLQKPYAISAHLEKELQRNKAIFTEQQELSLSVLTWNCAGKAPPADFDISQQLYADYANLSAQTMPDIVVVGLQEMVELSTKKVIQGKDKPRAAIWESIISRCLNQNRFGIQYMAITQKLMVGCYIIMFAKGEYKDRFRQLRKVKVKSGFSGIAGNKGSVGIRFNFDDTSFAFINVHLAAGVDAKAMNERLENIKQIYNDTFQDFSLANTQEKCYHDYKCFFGDMNFRVELDNKKVREMIEQKNYKQLVEKDQLTKIKDNHPILKNYNEGSLNFDPTYKYDLDSNLYDSSSKGMAPAWADRILMCRDPQFKRYLVRDAHKKDDQAAAIPEFYHRKESFFSDHRPVLAIYKLQVVKTNRDKKETLRQEILNKLLGQNRVDKKVLQNMDNVVTNEFSKKLSNLESDQKKKQLDVVSESLNFDEKPALMNRAWDPSMAIKVKKGQKNESQQSQSEISASKQASGLYEQQNQASAQSKNEQFNFNAPSQPFGNSK